MANINNVVKVSLSPTGKSVARDNMNAVTIMTSSLGVLSSANRWGVYADSQGVEQDFGTTSQEAKFANVFFSQTPNPVSADGSLIFGYWRAVDENVDATSANLTGEQITEATALPPLQAISDGSFDITIDGSTENLTSLDFRVATDLDGVASIIDTALTGGTCVYSNQSMVITSLTTGVSSTITYATDGATGTSVVSVLGIDENSSSVLTQGADAEVLSAETKVEGISAVKSEVNFKGAVFIDNTTDQESQDLATWGEANEVMQYDVFSDPSNLDISISNPVWLIKLAGQTNYRMLYSKAGNRTLAVGYMSRAHVVSFTGTNTAITMNLKEITGVVAEDYTQTEIDNAQKVGLDIYTIFKESVPKMLTSGANDYTDNVYNIIAYIDAVQTDAFNILGTTPTKVSQTTAGLNLIIDGLEKTSQQFVTANVFGAGTWNNTMRFGDVETFDRNIEEKGYYWYSIPLSEQPQSEREERKTPLLQNAVKLAGAFHEIIIAIYKEN